VRLRLLALQERLQPNALERLRELRAVLLPFIRVVNEASEASACPTILRRENAAAPARSLRAARRGEQRNVQ
jgi:hypothetical protein